MLKRAVILLLLVLNAGVAIWWALAPDKVPAEVALPSTTPRLQLLSEVQASRPRPAAPLPVAPQPTATASIAPTPQVLQCWRFGPFTDAAALSRAQAWLQSRVVRSAATATSESGRGWRVWLPPLADHDTAQAMAQQIAAAGITDYYIVPDGAEANSIALGRYGNAEAAQRRVAALHTAGFDAKAEPLGATTQWLEVAATPGFDADAAREAVGAAQRHPLDCAQLH